MKQKPNFNASSEVQQVGLQYNQLMLPNCKGGGFSQFDKVGKGKQTKGKAKGGGKAGNKDVIKTVVIQTGLFGSQLQSRVFINTNSYLWISLSNMRKGGKEAFEPLPYLRTKIKEGRGG